MSRWSESLCRWLRIRCCWTCREKVVYWELPSTLIACTSGISNDLTICTWYNQAMNASGVSHRWSLKRRLDICVDCVGNLINQQHDNWKLFFRRKPNQVKCVGWNGWKPMGRFSTKRVMGSQISLPPKRLQLFRSFLVSLLAFAAHQLRKMAIAGTGFQVDVTGQATTRKDRHKKGKNYYVL